MTSMCTTWARFALAQHPDVEQRSLAELGRLPDSGEPGIDVLQALPWLDAILHGSLRMHTPAVMLNRVATRDDVLPLSVVC